MANDVPDLAAVMYGRRNEPEIRQQKLRLRSSERLMEAIRKKLNTAFIGAVAKFESYLGHLWGHGKREKDCTPEEMQFREVWDKCRTDVLNNGNNQIRAIRSEIKQYDVLWNAHKINLPVRGDDNDCEQKSL